jgi:hypothetical protein
MRSSTFLRKSGVVVLSAAAVIVFVGLSACGGGGGGITPTVTISPMQASVPVGQTAHFLATVNNSTSGVTWQVNGMAGGNISTVGSIVNDANNPLQGDYTAPNNPPATNPVSITAVLQGNTNIVSNAASVSITAAQGLQVNPSSTPVVAGANFTFSATLNGAPDKNVTWSVVAPNGGNPGTIGGASGVYIAPLFPPPGAQVTVKAVDGNNSGTATVTVQYGNASLQGTYAFAYTGDDGSGFFTVAGSFTANGSGNIGTGVEDLLDLNVGATQAVQISGGSYTVGPDGRTAINFTAGGNTFTLEAALTTNLHGLVIEYDTAATGSGTIDQQTTADFGSLSGPFVFSVSGADGQSDPLGFAGAFTASAGNIPNVNAILDVNDGGDVNNNCPTLNCNANPGPPDTSLSGSYSFDANNPNSGRGTITLNATNLGIFTSGSQVVFAFYMVDRTHLHLLEIDNQAATSGDIYEGLLGPFGSSVLPKGNYPITLGGTSTQGAYAAGGIFAANGTGSVSGGVFDNNSGGNPINKGLTINECAYGTGYSPNGVDQGTGRVDLLLSFSSGTGCTTPSHNVDEFALYPTALTQPSAVMLEIDGNFITGGDAYAQQGSAVSPTGSFAFNLTGQGIFHNQQGSYQQDAVGQLMFSGTAITGGNLNINNFYVSSLLTASVTTSSSTLGTVSGSFGRGTMKLTVQIPQGGGSPVYNMAYYYVDPSTYLLIDLDNNRIANGVIADQF